MSSAEIYQFPPSATGEVRGKRGPQVEEGYTRIANELLDALCKADFTSREFRVVHFVIRQTYGWGSKDKRLASTFIAGGTGLHASDCSKVLNELIRRNVVVRHGGSRSPVSLNKHSDQWIASEISKKQAPIYCPQSGQDALAQSGQDALAKKERKETPPTNNNSAREFPMSFDWQPTGELDDLLTMNGSDLKNYLNDDVLLEFKSFWMTRPDHKTQGGWHHKLLSALKSEKQRSSIMQGNRVANDGREGIPPCPHESILAAWDEILGEAKGKAPNILDWKGTKIAVALEERWREFFGDENTKARYSDLQGGVEWFRKAFQHFAGSSNFRQAEISIFDVFYKTRFSKAANGSLPSNGGAVR